MVQNTRHHRKLVGAGNREQIEASELIDGKTLDADRFVGIFRVQGNKKTAFGPGIGPANRDAGEGWSDLDLKALDGSGAVVDVAATLRWEVYDDPSRENLVGYSRTFTASDLRSAVNASRTEKVNVAAQMPLAGDDSYLVLAAKAKSANDGHDVSAGDSATDVGMAYSRYK